MCCHGDLNIASVHCITLLHCCFLASAEQWGVQFWMYSSILWFDGLIFARERCISGWSWLLRFQSPESKPLSDYGCSCKEYCFKDHFAEVRQSEDYMSEKGSIHAWAFLHLWNHLSSSNVLWKTWQDCFSMIGSISFNKLWPKSMSDVKNTILIVQLSIYQKHKT